MEAQRALAPHLELDLRRNHSKRSGKGFSPGPSESKRGAWGLGCFRKAAPCSQVGSGAPLLSFLGPYTLVRCLHPWVSFLGPGPAGSSRPSGSHGVERMECLLSPPNRTHMRANGPTCLPCVHPRPLLLTLESLSLNNVHFPTP